MSDEEKVAEGHQYLLEGDLDPGAQKTEDTEKEQPPDTGDKTGEQDTDVTPEVEEKAKLEETPPSDKEDTGEQPREYQGIKVGDKWYPDEAALVAGYQSLETTLGRQGDQIGQLTTKVTELEGQVPLSDGADDPEPERDPLDEVKTGAWDKWNTRQTKREIFAELKTAENEKQLKDRIAAQATAQNEIQTFLETNKDLSVGQLLKITRLMGEGKVSSYEEALSQVGNGQAEQGESDKMTRKKQEAADKDSKNLSQGGGAAKVGVDLDSLSAEEWGKMKKNMTQTDIDTYLAGEDIEA